jgi:adenylate cyclase
VFSDVDALAERHGVEKIKTVGDAYMAASGVPEPAADGAARMARFAVDLRRRFEETAGFGEALRIRVGMATGPVVAGVIGTRKFSYDVWGDTVNTAARMESHGEPMRIHVDARTREVLGGAWKWEERGEVAGDGCRRRPAERPSRGMPAGTTISTFI